MQARRVLCAGDCQADPIAVQFGIWANDRELWLGQGNAVINDAAAVGPYLGKREAAQSL
jgi:hypothetical protein